MKAERISTKVVILGLVFLFLVGCVSGGKTYTASGIVVDPQGNGIGDVNLAFENFGFAKTDAEGKWVKSGLSGNVKVVLEKEGLWFSTYTVSEASSSVESIGYTGIDNIQEAIDAAEDGEIITVPPGIYYENIDFNGKNITLTSIDPEDPEVVAATIIDGGESGAVVCICSGETNAVLTGFTITNGSGFSTHVDYGGGVYIMDSTAVISHNIIEKNRADHGGGICLNSWFACTIESNIMRDNVALYNGGGLFIESGQHLISNNIISDNHAYLIGGGGITIFHGRNTLEGNIISNNIAPAGGGIIISTVYTVPCDQINKITGNHLENNRAKSGGGLYVEGFLDAQQITDNVFRGNVVMDNGGGIYFVRCIANAKGNVMVNNEATLGGGLCLTDSDIILTANEFNANYAFIGCAFWKNSNSSLTGGDGNSLSADNDDNEYIDLLPYDGPRY